MRSPAIRDPAEPARAARRRSARRGIGLALLVFAPLLSRPRLVGGDEPQYALLAWSIAFDGDFALADETAAVERGSNAAGERFAGRRLDEHRIDTGDGPRFAHPVGLPLLAAPLLVAWRLFGLPGLPDLPLLALSAAGSLAGLLALRALAVRLTADVRRGALVAYATFFGSPLWYSSRTFFTEPFLASLTALAALAAVRRRFVACGLALGISFFIKESAAIVVGGVLFGVWLAAGRRAALRASLGPLLGFAAYVARNLLVYGSGPIAFFQPYRLGELGSGLLGTLLDPAHGLVPFFPLVVLVGFARGQARAGCEASALRIAASVATALVLLAAAWIDWRGGSCFGPRLCLPAIPIFGLLLAVASRSGLDRPGFRQLFLALAAIGIAIEVAAIADPFRAFWGASVPSLAFGSATKAAVFVAAALVARALLARLAAGGGRSGVAVG